jgi:sugar lactone lactonase YvrE
MIGKMAVATLATMIVAAAEAKAKSEGVRSSGISVFSPDGTHLGNIETGQPISNVVWGEDGSTLFVTGGSSVYRIRLATKGVGY